MLNTYLSALSRLPGMNRFSKRRKNLDTLYNIAPDPILAFGVLDTNWEHFRLTRNNDSLELIEDRLAPPFMDFLRDRLGGFENKQILELGPYEGYHTCYLHQNGAGQTVSVEGNPRNFLKCLIVKNHYGLDNTQFLLGDATKYLIRTKRTFDFILASGILYHLANPIAALRQMTDRSDAIGICTTIYDAKNLVFKMTGRTREFHLDGEPPIVLHERPNPTGKTQDAKFGLESSAWLLSREDLLRYLKYRDFRVELYGTSFQPGSHRLQLYAEKVKPIAES